MTNRPVWPAYSRRALDRVGGALVGARFACFAAFATVRVLSGVLCAVRLAFAAELRAKFTKSGMPFRAPNHRRRRGATNIRAVQARERAFRHLGRRVADVRRRAFIASHCAEHTSLNGTLHISFGFFTHSFAFYSALRRER